MEQKSKRASQEENRGRMTLPTDAGTPKIQKIGRLLQSVFQSSLSSSHPRYQPVLTKRSAQNQNPRPTHPSCILPWWRLKASKFHPLSLPFHIRKLNSVDAPAVKKWHGYPFLARMIAWNSTELISRCQKIWRERIMDAKCMRKTLGSLPSTRLHRHQWWLRHF